MRCSDSLTSIPPHFVAFVWWYRVCARSSLPGEGSAPFLGPALDHRVPTRNWTRRCQGLPSSWGTPVHACPVLRPRPASRVRPSWRERCCLPPGSRRRPRRFGSYEAELRGPHARCLRFAASVTRTPRKTRFQLVASLCWAGFTCRVPSKGFQSHHDLPLSQACLAHEPSFHLGLGRPSLRSVLRRGIA